jgi:predicted GIY-YIG superfamily endonuclease
MTNMRHDHFYVYMLLCRDGSVYVGHTDDLEHRIAQHRARRYCRYASTRLPVKLIFSDVFPTRDEAFMAERQIKGWRRSKKLALARGDWGVVVQLASIRSPERRAMAERASAAHGTSTSP